MGSGCFLGFECNLRQAISAVFSGIDYGWRLVSERGMGSPVVVTLKPLFETRVKLDDRGVFKEVNLLIFHAPPKSLDEDVVHPAAFAIHAYLHTKTQQSSGPFCRGELAALVGVEDPGDFASVYKGLVQSFKAESRFHGVGHRPAKGFA